LLSIAKHFSNATTSNSEFGDTNIFLKRMLIEVVTENYKQMLYESLASKKDARLDPPIRANERIMSGLFGTAIATIADRSRPEVRIDRDSLEENPELEEPKTSAGRVDYLAWYGNRTFAIELKMAYMNCTSTEVGKTVEKKWGTVVNQAVDAQNWLRSRQKEAPSRYPNPISLALMVVVGRRAVTDKNEKWNADISKFETALGSLEKPPQFIATYEFPQEFREQARRKKGAPTSDSVYVPFIAFIARAAVNKR
jgi:hypothetical protein